MGHPELGLQDPHLPVGPRARIRYFLSGSGGGGDPLREQILGPDPLGIRFLEGFHVEATRRLTGIVPQQQTVSPWIYPKSKDVLRAARLRTIGGYVVRRQHNITKTTKD